MTNCPYCGKRLDPVARTCDGCGAAITVPAVPVAAPAAPEPPESLPPDIIEELRRQREDRVRKEIEERANQAAGEAYNRVRADNTPKAAAWALLPAAGLALIMWGMVSHEGGLLVGSILGYILGIIFFSNYFSGDADQAADAARESVLCESHTKEPQ